MTRTYSFDEMYKEFGTHFKTREKRTLVKSKTARQDKHGETEKVKHQHKDSRSLDEVSSDETETRPMPADPTRKETSMNMPSWMERVKLFDPYLTTQLPAPPSLPKKQHRSWNPEVCILGLLVYVLSYSIGY